MADPHNLQRFVDAQADVYSRVVTELTAGRKRSHWIWFIFPQLRGLGTSATSIRYAISSRTEAEAYLGHSVLGPRLRECTSLVNRIEGSTIAEIFGYPDDLKFRSSMTLFANVTHDNRVFLDALEKYFAGEQDTRTLELL